MTCQDAVKEKKQKKMDLERKMHGCQKTFQYVLNELKEGLTQYAGDVDVLTQMIDNDDYDGLVYQLTNKENLQQAKLLQFKETINLLYNDVLEQSQTDHITLRPRSERYEPVE